jgi:glycosyltransferase involved in cell wall biosynthesis
MRARLGVAPDAFMGLAIMDIRSCPERKNPCAHVRAWKAAFGDDPACVLVMKLRVGRHTAMVLSELRELVGTSGNVLITAQDMSSDEIAALHRAADVFVSLHRAEGFGLNILESLLIEKDVVATHWSANAEYGPDFVRYRPVPVRLVQKRDWSGHYSYQNFAWSDPDLSTAAAHLRTVRQAARNPPRPAQRNVAA